MNLHISSSYKIYFILLCVASNIELKGQSSGYSDEIGLHAGSFAVSGDVDHSFIPGFGLGLHYRKAINHAISVRPEIFYGVTHGLDAHPSGSGLLNEPNIFNGYSENNPWFYAYQTRLLRISVQGIFELSNLGYSNSLKEYNFYLLGGIGISSHGTWLDLKDANGELYTDLIEKTSFGINSDYNTAKGRRAIKSSLRQIYDGTYETPGPKEEGKYRLGNETNISTEVSFGLGISRRLSTSFNISLEHEVIVSNNDYLDGKRWRTDIDQTTNIDVGHYTSIRLSYNLSVPKKKEPQYWINPWVEKQELIDSLSKKVASLEQNLKDSDGDGVIDAMDQQKNSAANCTVDSKGVTLDSDKDGIADCYDKFPFGDKADIEAIVDDYMKKQSNSPTHNSKNRIDTTGIFTRMQEMSYHNLLFPILFFDFESYQLTNEQYENLASIADFMHTHQTLCLEVIGYADDKGDLSYNETLGLKRASEVVRILKEEFGIDSEYLKVTSKGEKEPLIINQASGAHQRINRRVTFKICY